MVSTQKELKVTSAFAHKLYPLKSYKYSPITNFN